MIKNILLKLKENITEREAEILAWIIASEGCISLTKSRNPKARLGFLFRTTIQIANTEHDFVKKTCTMLGKPLTNFTILDKNRKPVYTIAIRKHKEVIFLLEKIIPFLPIKVERALLLKEFCISRSKKSKHSPYSQRELEIFEELKRLNKRGLH